MGCYWSLKVLISFYASLWVFIRVLTVTFRSLLVFINPHVFLWVYMGPYWSLKVLISSCGAVCVIMVPYVSLFVLIGHVGFLLVLINP